MVKNGTDRSGTVGKAAYDLLIKPHQGNESPIAYEREMHKEFEQDVYLCIDNHKPVFDGDFYVVVLRKRERLMSNVYRTFFLGRKSCPTPTFDQTVYKYHRSDEIVEFLWVVPDQETCVVFKRDALEIVPEEKDLLAFVLDYYDGTLDKKAALLNNETIPVVEHTSVEG